MNLYQLFYLVSIADKLNMVFEVFYIIAAIVTVVAFVFWLFWEGDSDERVTVKRLQQIFLSIFLVNLILFIGTPTKKDLILIVAAGSVGEFVLNDDNAKEIPAEIFELLRKEILSQINEIDTDVAKDKFQKLTKEQLIQELVDQQPKE